MLFLFVPFLCVQLTLTVPAPLIVISGEAWEPLGFIARIAGAVCPPDAKGSDGRTLQNRETYHNCSLGMIGYQVAKPVGISSLGNLLPAFGQ